MSKVYQAESLISWGQDDIGFDKSVSLISDIWNKKEFKAAFPKAAERPAPIVQKGRRGWHPTAHLGKEEKIVLPPNWRNISTVLHEVAHIVTEREYAIDEDWHFHSWRWCQTLLFLITLILGEKEASDMTIAFVMEGVKFHGP